MKLFTLLVLLSFAPLLIAQAPNPMLQVGVVSLTHDHVHAVLDRHAKSELEIVGISEQNRELADRFSKRYGFSMGIVYDTIEEMLDRTKPQVVSDYGSTFGHLKTVEAAAARQIHVMVEKPLAVSAEHAKKIAELAKEHKIVVLTNYETTWYPSHHQAKQLLEDKAFGGIRKMVVHDGHPGPIEIGCSKEFCDWLIDPIQNGGGVLMDFGCYGANLSTWLMKGDRPLTVTAVTQQIKPDVYPNVEDEATIILTYPTSQTIIQASWNWSYHRKDIEIYTKEGFVHCLNDKQMSVLDPKNKKADAVEAKPVPSELGDPYKYFAAVVRGGLQVKPSDLSALDNNLIVVEILDAAKRSAAEGITIKLDR